MSTYKAWDGNDYPSPPPDGWYEGADALWWPDGYGPGPAAQAAPAPEVPAPEAPAPAPAPEAPRPAPAFEAPQAAAPAFDTDPTTILPTAANAPANPYDSPGFAPPQGHEQPAPAGYGAPEPERYQTPPPSGYATPNAPVPADPGNWNQPPGAVSPPGYDTAAPGGGSSNKMLLMIAAGLLGLVIIAGGAFAVLRGGGDTDPVAFDPSAEKGSAANPHTAGDLVRISYDDPDSGAPREWTIEVLSEPVDTSTDGDDIADATVSLRVALTEADGSENLSKLSFLAVDSDGKRYQDGGCETVTDALPDGGLVTVGFPVEGAICWQVPAADLAGLAMMVEVDGIDGQVHMKLQ